MKKHRRDFQARLTDYFPRKGLHGQPLYQLYQDYHGKVCDKHTPPPYCQFFLARRLGHHQGGQVDNHFINLIKIIMDCNDHLGQTILCKQEKLPGRRSKLCPGSLFST